jgi:hypothetical protein
MVYVPDISSEAEKSKGSRVGYKPDKTLSGRFIMLGGYMGGDPAEQGEMNDVWELRLKGASPKKAVMAVCEGCGKYDFGRYLCTGSCGGAVAVCGPECHKKVWNEGHKKWCTRKS